jgi:hypothetical protein
VPQGRIWLIADEQIRRSTLLGCTARSDSPRASAGNESRSDSIYEPSPAKAAIEQKPSHRPDKI